MSRTNFTFLLRYCKQDTSLKHTVDQTSAYEIYALSTAEIYRLAATLTPFLRDALLGSSLLVTTWPLLSPTANPEATILSGLESDRGLSQGASTTYIERPESELEAKAAVRRL
jgi:hypothetical protein